MPRRSVQLRYERLGERITGPVLDSILIPAWSGGVLYLPGEYHDRPPGTRCDVSATNRERCEVEATVGGYRVWNYNDSAAFADLVLVDDAEPECEGVGRPDADPAADRPIR